MAFVAPSDKSEETPVCEDTIIVESPPTPVAEVRSHADGERTESSGSSIVGSPMGIHAIGIPLVPKPNMLGELAEPTWTASMAEGLSPISVQSPVSLDISPMQLSLDSPASLDSSNVPASDRARSERRRTLPQKTKRPRSWSRGEGCSGL